ncbi:MAG: VgrG-related protein [Chloroflexota bacterium]|nr:VgrG-related protein [Chloroflexota bacterium]
MTDTQRKVGRIVIQVNGNDLAPDVASSLDEAIIEDDLLQPAMFVLRFNDPQHTLIDGDQLKIGAEIKIGATSTAEGQPKPILSGEITALEPALEQHNMVLVVRGYDRSHRLHRGSKTRTFLKQTDGDIATQIARENSLRPDVESTSGQHEYVMQDNQTDMQFLRERAIRIGYQVVIEEQKLKFRRAEGAPPKAPIQEWGQTLQAFRSRLTAAALPNDVQVRGWDPKTKRPLVGKASRAAQPSRIGDGKSGGQVAQQAFGTAATMIVSDQPVRSQGEADKLAQSVLDELGGDYLYAEGTCFGEPAIRAGTEVELKGIGKRLGGTYFVTATRHSYTSQEGYQTTFYVNGRRAGGLLSAIDGRQHRPAVAGVVVGIVTNNNDPDKLGRVKLKFPWLDDQHESDWARLASTGAGATRGFFAVPEIDDEVLVAFEQGDVSRPYVIGGLWNGKDKTPRDDAVQGGKVQYRIFKTRAGHSITLCDKDGQGQIEIKTGKHTLTLDDQGLGKLTIESGGDLDLKASSGKFSINAREIELTSSSTLKVQANAMLDVKSNAVLNIQGSLVKIN